VIDEIVRRAEQRMGKSVESLCRGLRRLRTGRAHPDLLESLRVSAYGAEMPLQQVAKVSVADARTLLLNVWDKGLVESVERAIRDSNLGLNPVTAGLSIRVPLPPLSEERRRELARLSRAEAERARVAVRNIRRDAVKEIKGLSEDKGAGQDVRRRGEESLQRATDDSVARIDAVLADKEKELLEF